MRHIASLLAITLLSWSASAQDEPPEELPAEEEIRRYTVEVIVFSYEEAVSVGTEIFVPDEPPMDNEELLIDLDELVREPPELVRTPLDEETARKLELVVLKKEELTLAKIARQFELLDVYEPIMHFGWTQPTLAPEETRPIELRVFGDPPAGLDGTFRLYLSRYLHLVVDLALDAPEGAAANPADDQAFYGADPAYSFGDSRLQYEDELDRHARQVRYRIQEDRIVKNGDLRYFDHPKFGVLAKITRVEEAEEDDEELFDPLLSSTR